MITEEMLRAAATASCARYVDGLTAGYDPEDRHVFSPEFEHRMEKLRRRADRAPRRAALQRVAAVLLALLLAGAAWLAVNEEARAAVFGWVRSLTDSYFVYHHEGGGETAAGPGEYRPTWLPEGYEEYEVNVFADTTTVFYLDSASHVLRFHYAYGQDSSAWFLSTEHAELRECRIGDMYGTLWVSTSEDTGNGITWIQEEKAFYISGFVDEQDLIKMAESVQKN